MVEHKTKKKKIVFTSMSKRNFYMRMHVSKFVLDNNYIPINPFMIFEYNLLDTIDRQFIRISNNTLINKADELWIFGEISDGVLAEIQLAQKFNKKVRFFDILSSTNGFIEISGKQAKFESDVEQFRKLLFTKKNDFHVRLLIKKKWPLVYPAYSKRNFFLNMHISKFVLEKNYVPLNPFMIFKYFLIDSTKRNIIYSANKDIISMCDELWIIGEVSDGVLDEIKFARKNKIKIKYFSISKDELKNFKFKPLHKSDVSFEDTALKENIKFL